MMSHEIRTPLNTIIGRSDILLRRYKPKKESTGQHRGIKLLGKNSTELTDQRVGF
ncbi:histidine kinase dimerization/phospho-acceptor domain-containing protein [Maribacter antarcticus]|uniref:histidine kinase dimerization/phospho-acceptor domain-containing protein n=1 Tax=Maribacter antarcticus TaxID=505250 RepID=UPI0012EB2935|nr:histidine kinase dimerization/phospho-acceptor domain-containing protein [Maribacter antarcticus]